MINLQHCVPARGTARQLQLPHSGGNGRQILEHVEYKYKEMWDKYGWPSSDARNAVSSSLKPAFAFVTSAYTHCTTPAYNVGPTSHWMGLPTTLYIYIYLRTLYIWHRTLHIFVQPTRSSYNSLYHPCQHLRTSHSISLSTPPCLCYVMLCYDCRPWSEDPSRDCLMAPKQSASTLIDLTSEWVIPLKNLPYSCKYSTGETLKVWFC